jgi:hypothetical protein
LHLLRSTVATRLRRCQQRLTNNVTSRRPHGLRSLRTSHLQRGAFPPRLQCWPRCPQQALLQTSEAVMRVRTTKWLRCQNLHWRFVPVPNLTVTLVNATSLECPVLPSKWLSPTQNFCIGGLLCNLPPHWREQPHLVAWWCRLLHQPGRHLLLPPSNPFHSMKKLIFLPGEGTPIHSVRENFLFLHGSEHDANTARIVLVGVISLALPINLLDGLRWGAVYWFVSVHLYGRFLPLFP